MLRDSLTLISGAKKGIGRAIALNLASRGCSILGTYSSPESAHNFDVLTHTIQDLYRNSDAPPHLRSAVCPRLKGVAADITSLSSISPLLLILKENFNNKLDIFILNASYNVRPKLGTASEAYIQNSLVANLHWPIVLIENIVQQSLLQPSSRIVLISSDRVRDPSPGSSLFNATKAGLESLTRSWALELPLSFPGTTVNAVSVGLTDTPGLRSFPPAAVEALKAQRLKKVKVVGEGGRMGYAEDVADVVGWLVSEKARWVSGSVVAANGGAEWIGGSS